MKCSIDDDNVIQYTLPLLDDDPVFAWYRDNLDQIEPGRLRLAVDFDNTMTDNGNCRLADITPTVRPGAVEALRDLYNEGWMVIIHSARFDTTVFQKQDIKKSRVDINRFLYANSIPCDMVWDDTHGGKPLATYYLDDRSFPPFPGWAFAYHYLQEFISSIEVLFLKHNTETFKDVMACLRRSKIQNISTPSLRTIL